MKPLINKQFDNFSNVLKLYGSGKSINRSKKENRVTVVDKPPENLEVPDMETILRKFKINVNMIENSPELDYDTWEHNMLYEFGGPMPQTTSQESDHLTISQRIKSMRRNSKKVIYK